VITRKTILILGAGASKPYGFPLGGELTDILIAQLVSHGGTSIHDDLLQHCEIAPEELTDFLRAFSRSGLSSIDSFLARRDEYSRLGKLAIAWALCSCESRDWITRRGNDDHWYSLLWDTLTADTHASGDFRRNQLRVITFNYDRSLEFFLNQAAKNTYRLTDSQAQEFASTIGVLHVYGKLGELTFDGRAGTRIYDNTLSRAALNCAADGILIVPEARDDAREFMLARTWCDWAEQICFLGFGFDPLNVRCLGLVDVLTQKKEHRAAIPTVWASVFGKTAAEIDWIRDAICAPEPSVFHHIQHQNVLAMRNTRVLL